MRCCVKNVARARWRFATFVRERDPPVQFMLRWRSMCSTTAQQRKNKEKGSRFAVGATTMNIQHIVDCVLQARFTANRPLSVVIHKSCGQRGAPKPVWWLLSSCATLHILCFGKRPRSCCRTRLSRLVCAPDAVSLSGADGCLSSLCK